MAHRRFDAPPYDAINLTPLIDTLFFLLIIFMLTAPLLENSIDVTPPEMNADKLPDEDKHAKVVNVKKDGTIVFDRTEMNRSDFLMRVSGILQDDPKAKLYLRADRELQYGQVIDLLSAVKKSGFANIFLVTSEETGK